MKLIAAADKNWAIGKDGELLVRISEDMKNFSAITTGNVYLLMKKIIMEKVQSLCTVKKNCGKNFQSMIQTVFL